MYVFLTFLISFIATFFVTRLISPRLKKKRMVGRDMNKPGHPEISEMGGLGIVSGFEVAPSSCLPRQVRK